MADEPLVDPGFLAGKRILVVEDEFLIALDIERILELVEATHISVSRNRDALLALQGGDRFDFAILDYKLNGDNSGPVADRLTELGVPFIFLTGTSTLQVPEQYRAVTILQKPFDANSLIAALNSAAQKTAGRG